VSVLDDINSGVREDMEARQRLVSLAELKERAAESAPARDAWAALGGDRAERNQLKVIAEIKRRSPSKGDLASIADPASLAVQYADGGAAVISVLTEQRRFNGSLADLGAVRAAVDIPLLRKDFMIDEYQIWEARAHGADLILLIVASLSDAQLREYSALSRELGVNVRDLKTLDVDRSVFAELAGGIPSGALVVAESGVRGVDDVRHYAANGANAVLVGEALVKNATPRERIAEFMAAGAEEIAARA
jgi:indole-3-glycerol phosphate synthase